MRIVDLYINMATGAECDSVGRAKSQPTRCKRTDRVLLRWHLFADDGATPYPLEAGSVFEFGVDSVFTAANPDLVTSLNDRFLSSDWSGTEGWSLVAGRFCNRAVFRTSELATAMGAAAEKKMYACVYATPPGGEPDLLFQIPIMVDGVAVEPGGGAEAHEEDSYVTVSQLAAMLQVAAGMRLLISEAGEITVESVT